MQELIATVGLLQGTDGHSTATLLHRIPPCVGAGQ